MSFNEQNTVEHFIIHQLTGVNLNKVQGNIVKENAVAYDTVKWKYVQADLLQRDITDVFVEKELKEALCRLNSDIASNPDKAEEVIHKLRAILITVNNVGLVRANEEFAKWLRNEVTLPIGKNNEHVAIRLIDDCTFDFPRGSEFFGQRFIGKAQVREALAGRFKGIPDVHYDEDRHWLSADGARGVSEWTLTGTSIAGIKIKVRDCDIWESRNEKIIRKDSYWKIVEKN